MPYVSSPLTAQDLFCSSLNVSLLFHSSFSSRLSESFLFFLSLFNKFQLIAVRRPTNLLKNCFFPILFIFRIRFVSFQSCAVSRAELSKILMGPVRIRQSSHHFAIQSSHSVDRAGRQVKMASIEFWIP